MTNEELVKLIQSGENTKKNLAELYFNNIGFINCIVSRYSQVAEHDDLMQEAYLGLQKATEKYDGSRGYKFLSFAGEVVKRELCKYVNQKVNLIRIPDYMRSKVFGYRKVCAEYVNKYGKQPSQKMLCHMLDCSKKELRAIQSADMVCDRCQSIHELMPGTDRKTVEDVLPDEENIEEKVLKNIEEEKAIAIWDIVDSSVSESGAQLLRMKFIEGLNNLEISAQMDIEADTVAKEYMRTLSVLRRYYNVKRLKQYRNAGAYEKAISRAYKGSIGSFKLSNTSSTEEAAIMLLKDAEEENSVIDLFMGMVQ